MAIGDDEYDLLGVARRRPFRNQQSNFPAVNQINQSTRARNTAFAHAPVNTLAMNMNQIPIGGFGLGALAQAGYSRSPQMNLDSFMGSSQPSQPTMTGFRWNKGTGGVSGGNNDLMQQFYSNGTMKSFTGGVEDNQPLAPTQYTLPGVNADVRALSDPSVGALAGATRTNSGGQQFINPTGGGQIISGPAGSQNYGSLQGSTRSTNDQGQQVVNTPSGGQIIAGKPFTLPAVRQPYQDVWRGGWMSGGY